MGRAGAGGGGHSSGGGHSAGRAGGGHHVSSGGSRPGGGSFGGSRPGGGSHGGGFGGPIGGAPRGGMGGPGMPHGGGMGGPGMPPPGGRMGGPGMPPPPRRRRGGNGCGTTIAVFVFVILFMIVFFFDSCADMMGSSSVSTGSTSSTIVREKLDTDDAYINDCVVDELGWFDNVSKTESRLKSFWEETGIQPYIILKDYDASLTTDSQKEQWAKDYYDANFDTENIFLFVYFAEEDVEGEVGYMAYANGRQTSSVMDSEAVEIFWNNIDKYWYSDASTDDMFVNAFNDTAETIMHVSTTGKDIFKWLLIVAAIIIVGVIVINLVKEKNRRAKEKAEEDQKILNTPIHDVAKDNLEEKYLK